MTDRARAESVGFTPVPLVPLAAQPPARFIVDSPPPEPLARGLVGVRYRTENLRVAPVFGPPARDVSPRVGDLRVTVDDARWHRVDASGETFIVHGLSPGPHEILIELADPTHAVIAQALVGFDIPRSPATRR